MLRRISIRKILVSTAVLFALFLVYLIPKNEDINLEDKNVQLEYVDYNTMTGNIYLEDSNGYLSRTSIEVSTSSDEIEAKAREILQVLIKDGSGENKIPSGFKAILPSDTKINSIIYDHDILKIDLSKETLEVTKEEEEKIIEAIVYSLTSINGVDRIIIYIDGSILTKLPQTKINLPSTLDKSFGINKIYDLTSTNNINQVTVYYISKFNDNYYYVPVTKYLNDDREKINIVVEELTGSLSYGSNLMSFLNSDTKLISVNSIDNTMELEFNNSIFNDLTKKDILEQVLYTICLSVEDNYDVDKVVFTVDSKPVYQSVLKEIK